MGKLATCQELAHSIGSRARGFYSGLAGLVGVRARGRILWFSPTDGGWKQTGSTETPEGAEYVRFDEVEKS